MASDGDRDDAASLSVLKRNGRGWLPNAVLLCFNSRLNVSKCCRPSKFPWGLRFPVRPPPGARPLCYDAEVFGKGIERGRVIGKVIGGAQGEG